MNFFVILLFMLSGGIYGMLHRIPRNEIGDDFYRLITYLYLIGMTVVLISFRPTDTPGWVQFSLILLGLAAGFAHRFTLGDPPETLRKLSYWTGVAAILAIFVSISYQGPLPSVMKKATSRPVNVLHLVTSAAILGAIVDAMICGHWYLVNAELSLNPIRSISRTLTAVVLLKIVLVGWSLIQTKQFDPYLYRKVVFLLPILFWVRLLVGLGGGLFFNWMSWKALEHGNTQAATGILYACITWIILGEFSGFYLTVRTGVPL